MIEFKNVTKRYGDKVAVDNVSFNIREGEFFVLIGPSGCGKTTTLKMINRLIPLSEGYIYFKNKPISDYPVYEMRWDIGYVLQEVALFPHMTIKENIAQVPQMKKQNPKEIDARVDALLKMVGLEPELFKHRKPSELSGGQSQRVGVVRALAADPPVILMDEPFSALDPISREKLQDDLIQLQREIKKTIIFVTHDMQEAMKLGDRICLFNKGHIEQIDTPNGFLTRPNSAFVKQFMGQAQTSLERKATLEDIVREIKGLPCAPFDTPHDHPTVDSHMTVRDVYDVLAQHHAVCVKHDGETYCVTRAHVFQFLADKQQRGDQDA